MSIKAVFSSLSLTQTVSAFLLGENPMWTPSHPQQIEQYADEKLDIYRILHWCPSQNKSS